MSSGLTPALDVPIPATVVAGAPVTDLSVHLVFGEMMDGYRQAELPLSPIPPMGFVIAPPGYVEAQPRIMLTPRLELGRPARIYDRDDVSLDLTAERGGDPTSLSLHYQVRVAGRLAEEQTVSIASNSPALGGVGVGFRPLGSDAAPHRMLAVEFYRPIPASSLFYREPKGAGSHGPIRTAIQQGGHRAADDSNGPITCINGPAPWDAATSAAIARGEMIGVQLNPARTAYQSSDGRPLPPQIAALASPTRPRGGWCDQPATAADIIPIDHGPAARIELVLRLGRKLADIPPQALDAIRSAPPDLFAYDPKGWSVATQTLRLEPFQRFGEPAVIYQQGDTRIEAELRLTNAMNQDLAAVDLNVLEAGRWLPMDILGAHVSLQRGAGWSAKNSGFSTAVLSIPSAAEPDRVMAADLNWDAARSQAQTAAEAAPVFGSAIDARVASGSSP
ncbi:MAG: hypothetical protein JWM33_4016 [Caulobacteraceae bacterium]|nr:hypothetical protein [Caulobacteraceae bacterium]